MLAAIRFGAGLFTPLVSAILFIFDRVDSPKAVVRGMGLYAMGIITAYSMGGVVVGLLYTSLGWAGISGLSAGGSAIAFLYVTFLSSPPLTSERPKPKGLWRALRTADFLTHATTALVVGYQMNCSIFMCVIILKEEFRWGPQAVGWVFLAVPATMLPVNNFLLPRLAARFGLHRLITVATVSAVACSAGLAGWSSQLRVDGAPKHVAPLLVLFCPSLICLMFQQNPNQARGKYIADRYATNARGAVTSISRNFFALGQALAPIVSGAVYNVNPFWPYVIQGSLIACNLLLFIVTGVPLWNDPPQPDAKPPPVAETSAEPSDVTSATSQETSTTDPQEMCVPQVTTTLRPVDHVPSPAAVVVHHSATKSAANEPV